MAATSVTLEQENNADAIFRQMQDKRTKELKNLEAKIQAGTATPQEQQEYASEQAQNQRIGHFVKGAANSVVSMVTQPFANVYDLNVAAYSTVYNVVFGGQWYPTLISGIAQANNNGASQLRLIGQSIPGINVGFVTYDMTTAGLNGNWNAVAEQAGSATSSFAVGALVSKTSGASFTEDVGTSGGSLGRQTGANSAANVVKHGEFSIASCLSWLTLFKNCASS